MAIIKLCERCLNSKVYWHPKSRRLFELIKSEDFDSISQHIFIENEVCATNVFLVDDYRWRKRVARWCNHHYRYLATTHDVLRKALQQFVPLVAQRRDFSRARQTGFFACKTKNARKEENISRCKKRERENSTPTNNQWFFMYFSFFGWHLFSSLHFAIYTHRNPHIFPQLLLLQFFVLDSFFSDLAMLYVSSPLTNNFLCLVRRRIKRLGMIHEWCHYSVISVKVVKGFESSVVSRLKAPWRPHCFTISAWFFWSALKEFIRLESVRVESWKFYEFSKKRHSWQNLWRSPKNSLIFINDIISVRVFVNYFSDLQRTRGKNTEKSIWT